MRQETDSFLLSWGLRSGPGQADGENKQRVQCAACLMVTVLPPNSTRWRGVETQGQVTSNRVMRGLTEEVTL